MGSKRHTASIGAISTLILVTGCARLAEVGQPPEMSYLEGSDEYMSMSAPVLPTRLEDPRQPTAASLWSGNRGSLLGDRRAGTRGDLLTVVIEIDERAEMSNSTERSRAGSEDLSIDALVGLPEAINNRLPDGTSLSPAAKTASKSKSEGDGTIRRREKLTLRVAATVVGVMPNGVFQIQGTQEVRVNFELRELVVTGFVRPEDISRKNEITYDKIASARFSYAGRGQITDVQQPRYGQQVADILLPF